MGSRTVRGSVKEGGKDEYVKGKDFNSYRWR